MPNIMERDIERVGFDIVTVSVRPTVTAGAYSAKDAVGGRLQFDNSVRFPNGAGIILGATLIDLSGQVVTNAALDLVLFNQSFTADADNAVFDPTDPAMQNLIGVIRFVTADFILFNANTQATRTDIWMPFTTVGTTSLFGQFMCPGTPTYVATNDVTIKLRILRS
jgi:hypothetical protein